MVTESDGKDTNMKMIKRLLFVTLLIGSANSYACKCFRIENLKEAVSNASSVFLGTAVSAPLIVKGRDYQLVSFSVEKSWKGITGLRAQVKVGRTSCSAEFEIKKKYLVFVSEKGPIYTGGCSRTKPFEEASDDIAQLGIGIPLK